MPGCLIVLDRWGHVATTIQGKPINGPWDMTAWDHGDRPVLFVSNVLNGTVAANGAVVNGGTVARIDLKVEGSAMPVVKSETVVGWGFPEKSDPAALVIGPTGLALDHKGNLYVADTQDNRIAVISNALWRDTASHRGRMVSENGHLMQPLGLALAPNGDILTVNGGDGNAVEVTPKGHQVAVKLLDSSGAGTLFGLAVAPGGHGFYFVDDGMNNLQLLH
jgi:DNA-binding beta-propeller fold protein YncE